MRAFVRDAIVAAALLIAASLILSTESLAAPRIGTFAWNYKNRPVVAPYNGYELVAVSARAIVAPGIVDSLRSFGALPIVWLQPTVAIAGGAPLEGPDYPWDSAVLELVTRRNAILRTPDGRPADLFPPSGSGYEAWLLDYRDSAFVDEFAALIVSRLMSGKAAGVLWDYGCGDVSWNQAIGVDGATWLAWRRGFVRLVAAVRALRGGGLSIVQCDQYPADLVPVTDGVFYEQAGMSLNPLAKVWANVNRNPGRWTLVRVEELAAQKRRAFATLSLVTGSRFNWSDVRGDYGGGTMQNFPDLEHFGLSVGPTSGPIVTKAPGVYARAFTRGVAVLNTSAAPYVYALTSAVRYTVQPGDGLVMQTRDERGRYIKRLTNEGR